jgi:hypothetical protein
MLGSIGTGIDSRRAAVGNLLTNVNNAVISILLAPLWIPLLERSSVDLVHQIANTHTFLMLQNCLVFMPIVPLYARFPRFGSSPRARRRPSPPGSSPSCWPTPNRPSPPACRTPPRRPPRRRSLRLAGQTILFAHTPAMSRPSASTSRPSTTSSWP